MRHSSIREETLIFFQIINYPGDVDDDDCPGGKFAKYTEEVTIGYIG